MHHAFHYADLGVLEGWPISGRKRFYMEAIIILYHIHEHHIINFIQFKYQNIDGNTIYFLDLLKN